MIHHDIREIREYELRPGEVKFRGWFTGLVVAGVREHRLVAWMENSLTKLDIYSGEQIERDDEEKVEVVFRVIQNDAAYTNSLVGQYIGTVNLDDDAYHIFMKYDEFVKPGAVIEI